jgi:hypothetical protein
MWWTLIYCVKSRRIFKTKIWQWVLVDISRYLTGWEINGAFSDYVLRQVKPIDVNMKTVKEWYWNSVPHQNIDTNTAATLVKINAVLLTGTVEYRSNNSSHKNDNVLLYNIEMPIFCTQNDETSTRTIRQIKNTVFAEVAMWNYTHTVNCTSTAHSVVSCFQFLSVFLSVTVKSIKI